MQRLLITFLVLISIHTYGQRYGTGLIFNDANYAKAKVRANFNTQNFDLLPPAYSLKKYCPSPGNQMQLNTSPAWATAWSAVSVLEGQTQGTNTIDVTPSPSYLYQNIRKINDQTCEEGIDLFEALEFIRFNELKKYDDFQEFCPRNLPEDAVPVSSAEIRDYRKLFNDYDNSSYKINVVKKSISQDLPVVIGMHCPPSFFKVKNYWKPAEVMNRDFPGHALCVVGYNDEKYGGSFEVLNSWGKEWGNQGYIWIPYEDFVAFTKYAYEVFYVNNLPTKNQLSGSIYLKLNTDDVVPIERIDDGVFTSIEPFDSSTYFRVYVNNDMPAFVYLFGVDAEYNYFRVFPDQDSISAALIYVPDKLTIPGEDKYIRITGDPGKENLCILYSKIPLEINSLIANLSKYQGDLKENLDALLDGKIIKPREIQWNPEGIQFVSNSEKESVVFIQIHINHI